MQFLKVYWWHWQDRVNEEIDRVFGDSDRPVTMPDLSELKYLECCLKEALRLYPSVPIIGRELTEDTVIRNKGLQSLRYNNLLVS